MKTAIIYASKHGTTETVAVSIADKLLDTNEVELFSLKKTPNPDISGFDAVILGTCIYAGQASNKMKTFCRANETALSQKKIGLFVCGMHPDKTEQEKELNDAYSEILHKNAVASGFMGGNFLFDRLNFFERLIVKKVAKTTTTVLRIDWEVINEFVEKIKNNRNE